ncbi:MAG: YihY/virulence factor BrkB family protein [Actinomycetota bacterium]|nr:YihY/virulence factor BrkB family protein [Actinomycetota bacterium]
MRKRRPGGDALEEKVLPLVAVGAFAAGAGTALVRRFQERREERPGGTNGTQDGRHKVGPFNRRSAGVEATAQEGPKGRVLQFAERRRWRWLGRTLQVQQRYGELRGNNLAASVTLQSFLSLFPLLLLVVAVLGFVAANSGTNVAGRIIGELGLNGDAAATVREAVDAAERSRRSSSAVGILGLTWSSLGLVAALQYAFNQAWQVEDRGMKDRAFGLLWLAGAGVLFVGAAAATTALRWLPGALAPLGVVVTMAVAFGLWLWTSKVLPNVDVGWRALVPGAVLGTVGLEALKVVGAYYVPKAVASSSDLYGTIGVVFAILAWLLLFGKLVVYAAVLDVVLYEGEQGTKRATVELPDHSKVADEVTRSGRSQVPADA